ncbi:hypothetical protein [Streptomyces sp. NPDC002346]
MRIIGGQDVDREVSLEALAGLKDPAQDLRDGLKVIGTDGQSDDIGQRDRPRHLVDGH